MKGTKAMIDSYVALDIETTGLNPAADRIIEIGMARVCNGNVADKRQNNRAYTYT